LDQSFFYPAKEIFRVHAGAVHGLFVVAVFQSKFLESDFRRIFRFEAPCHQFAGAVGKTFYAAGIVPSFMLVAIVLLKLGCRQAVEGALGVRVSEQRGRVATPGALGTSPSLALRL